MFLMDNLNLSLLPHLPRVWRRQWRRCYVGSKRRSNAADFTRYKLAMRVTAGGELLGFFAWDPLIYDALRKSRHDKDLKKTQTICNI